MVDIYRINGHEIFPPTSFQYDPRRPLDIQGDNRPIYPGVRTAQLKWQLLDYAEWANLQVLFNALESSGTTSVHIPSFPTATGSSYGFSTYSGCTLSEPSIGPFFQGFPSRVTLLIANIVTD